MRLKCEKQTMSRSVDDTQGQDGGQQVVASPTPYKTLGT